MDYREKLKDGLPGLQAWGKRIPGYNGYAERDLRREADKLLRMYVAQGFETQRIRLMELQSTLVSGKRLSFVGVLERPISKLQRLIDRLKTMSYGYTGLFDAVKVKTAELDQLYQFDYTLLAGMDELTQKVDAIIQTTRQDGDIGSVVSEAAELLEKLNLSLDDRTSLISRP